jgi:hypothetical protein
MISSQKRVFNLAVVCRIFRMSAHGTNSEKNGKQLPVQIKCPSSPSRIIHTAIPGTLLDGGTFVIDSGNAVRLLTEGVQGFCGRLSHSY